MIDREVLDADVLIELLDLAEFAPVHGKRHDLEVVAPERCFQPIEGRHFLAAGRAPGRPEIENDDTPLKIRETALITLCIEKRHFRHRPAVGRNEVERVSRLDSAQKQHAEAQGQRFRFAECERGGVG